MSPQRAIVTGGNVGLGLEVAVALASRGMDVTITSRDAAKGAAAAAAITSRAGGVPVRVEKLDLADLASVRAFAAVQAAAGPLDLLINNAGVMAVPKRMLTRDGFELQFGTNHLGHFALTGLLMPALLAAGAARVVAVSSIAHQRGKIGFGDLQAERGYSAWGAYAQSKLANLMFALELQRRLTQAGAPVISLAAHPGVAATNLMASGPMLGRGALAGRLGKAVFGLIGQSAARGALPILFAATAPGLAGGSYIGPDGFREMHGVPKPAKIFPQAQDAAVAAELWRQSEALTGVAYLDTPDDGLPR